MTDVFISYAQEDERRVRPLVKALEAENWSVFWDRQIPVGQTWESHIGSALEEAGCVLVFWSVHSVKSAAVKEEAGEGARRGQLVPVRLDEVEPPLGRGFRDIQFADLTGYKPGRHSVALRNLLKDIGRILEKTIREPTPASRHLKRAPLGERRQPRNQASEQIVKVGEVRFPKVDPKAHAFWDGKQEHLGAREIAVPVTFDVPFTNPPNVIVSLREVDLGDVSQARIHRISVRAENVRSEGFDLYFATWLESQVYGAVASWIAVGD